VVLGLGSLVCAPVAGKPCGIGRGMRRSNDDVAFPDRVNDAGRHRSRHVAIPMTAGRFYILRGGVLIRWPVLGVGQADVLREVTLEDARYLRVRWVQLAFRGLWAEAEWVSEIMAEVGVSPSPIPERFRPQPPLSV